VSAWRLPWPAVHPEPGRWIVLDTESTGLDPARDHLIAIAAIGIHVDWQRGRAALVPSDSFEVVLRPPEASSRENVLVHGIGHRSQAEGLPPAEGLGAFDAWADGAPRLAFHADFDRALLRRHASRGGREAPRWLDIAQLAAAVAPQVRARALDDWLDHYAIPCGRRHEAAADAWATGQLLLRLFPAAAAQCSGWRGLERLAAASRWLPRG
jgi:DNA polymerase-3 subunit epsilon